MQTDELDPAIRAALDAELGNPADCDRELFGRLRALIENCLADNYDASEVKAVIDLAMVDSLDAEPEPC
jgi:hypothetical protein